MTDIENIKAIVEAFDEGRTALTKFAFTPTASPAPPATAMPPGPPPGDPGMMPPPGDPNAMPPQGPPPGDPGMMPPPGDPNAMPPQGPPPGDPGMPPPPGDPNTMPPQGPPPPPPAGGIPPELEGALSQLAGGMDTVSQTVEQQQAQTDQLSQRMLAMEEELNSLRSSLKGPAPFEGGGTPADKPELGAALTER